ncbi:hypothetical protein AKJ41_01770 [candidate division MSBL1 archaeon SCGC-AAA259O05]|uniref:tRNA(Ile)-lysidine/2-thiocytidine synthase N-terminal domain-containing protein n=1 Tax=candidate division MSBL1 archaeon SCGC-AAA259O05 TaxID=1698271 RepID=A0A133V4J3_9EURY|nr:hypothetical protein AKJ41_01770 [candidate division MSBL1 archaeon SCGC-AAA259O05]
MVECSFCGRRAVYHERTAGVYRCDRCFEEHLEKKFRRTVNKNDLIGPGDRIVAAVSGGTDSVTNLHLLAQYLEYKEGEVLSLTIDEGIEGYRDGCLSVVRENSKVLGVEHKILSFEEVYGKSLDQLAKLSEEKNGPDPCTLCGILRRSLLNQAAREWGADKLAIGHNLDDVVQTIMLNYLRGDLSRLYRLGPESSGRAGFVPRIKPLREISEKEVGIYALLKNFSVRLGTCPHVGGMRTEVREFINRMEKNHPTTKYRILRMFDKIRPHLPVNLEDFELGKCEKCGEPATGRLCRSCELLENIGVERKKKRLISD